MPATIQVAVSGKGWKNSTAAMMRAQTVLIAIRYQNRRHDDVKPKKGFR